MLSWLFNLDQKRKKLLEQAPEGPMKNFLGTEFPHRKLPIHDVPLLAMDFETTGLDANKDHLLSVGHVELLHEKLLLGSARHQIIRSNREMADENISIHHITHDQVADGMGLEKVVESILEALSGKVLLAHHAKVEIGFLQQACRRLYGMAPVLPAIDTMQIARKRLERLQQPIQANELRLFNLRSKYGLPPYRAHNALMDAIATGELFLAQLAHGSYSKSPPLKNFLLSP
ncbi:exonuclease domain-containing protein [Thiolapillus brandeum]|uniref:DNA-directed DNA polymerase n=1 Tax=Thiolapillus brandeum TaxID=1076588 RepID=A0A7U6JGY3_9GAMM|nr:exonuclease domain-containing protein [Thiolapillus brandeum]BAO43989.1 DNA polymerase III epsilon subunit [Thiolapillus brandeum]